MLPLNVSLLFLLGCAFFLLAPVLSIQKPKLWEKHIKFISFYFPTNPHVQKLYDDGYKGGYGKKYEDPNLGTIHNFKYPFRQHVSIFVIELCSGTAVD